jgi:hypothetical protein
MREETTSWVMAADRPYGEFYGLYSVSLKYFGYTNVLTAGNETNLTHSLSSVYSVTLPLHVWGSLVAHHQEITMYILVCHNTRSYCIF